MLVPATSASSSGSTRMYYGPAGVSSSQSTSAGCKRSRDSVSDSDSVTDEADVESDTRPVTALGGHGWTRR
jgi:hypothetical protein